MTNNDFVTTGLISVRAAYAVAVVSVHLLLVCALSASADYFQYTDKDGTVVIVDDEGKIPEKFRNKAKTTKTENNGLSRKTSVTIRDNKVYVPVTLSYRNKTMDTTMLLDTGASITTISIDVAKRLGINPERTDLGVSSVADGREIYIFVTSLDFLAVGPKIKNNLQVSIMPANGPLFQCDGLLGMNFLRDFSYQLDMNNRIIIWMQ